MKASQIAGVVTPVLDARGLELDDVDIVSAGRRSILRITVDGDGPAGTGPTLDEIAKATREISAVLDESGVDGHQPYTLEVSSRGTSKPLTAPQHWRRNIGRLVVVTAAEPLKGRIHSCDETGADIDEDGTITRIEFADVEKAVIEVELTKPSKDKE